MKLTREEVQKIATLSRLHFTEEESDRLATQLSAILDYVAKLNELDTAEVPPTAYTLATATPLREDRVVLSPVRDAILKEVPDREGPLFKVPKVI